MSVNMQSDALKLCPFCGKAPHIFMGEHSFYDVKIRCNACGAEGPLCDVDDGDTPDRQKAQNIKAALQHWNGRVG